MNCFLFQIVRNEKDILPYKLKWAKFNGFQIYSIDNESTDGSYNYIRSQGLKCRKLNTIGMYSLKVLNWAYHQQVKKYCKFGDWVVIAAADMFYYARGFVKFTDFLSHIDGHGFNCVDLSKLFNFYPTLEDGNGDPRLKYFHYQQVVKHPILLAFKYFQEFQIDGENLRCRGLNVFSGDVVTLHYFLRDNWRKRKAEQLSRRMIAWQQRVDLPVWGRHYKDLVLENPGKEAFDIAEYKLQDIRKHWVYENITKELEGYRNV